MTDPRAVEQRVLDTWDFGDPATSAERFRVAADEAAEPSAAAVLRTQQARATGLAGDFAAAMEILDEISDDDAHAAARLAIERGRVLNSTGDPGAAAPLFAEARELALDAGVAGLALDALHMQAIAAGALSGPAASRVLNEQALVEIEASSDPQVRRWEGSILNNLGWDLFDTDPSAALTVFSRAVAVREAGEDHGALVVARWCVGRALRELGRYDEALGLQRSLQADPVGAADPYVAEEIALLTAD
jgi:tetratricopeptide (TPR) repeat protein